MTQGAQPNDVSPDSLEYTPPPIRGVRAAPASHGPTPTPPGSGTLHLEPPGRFTSLLASYPLKLLSPARLPSQPTNVGVAYTLAYGGGLVAGDVVSLKVEVGPGCGLVMLTQGSTKVYKHRAGIRPLSGRPRPDASSSDGVTRQRMHTTLRPGSFVLLLPDSVSLYKDSQYSQVQRFVLPADSSASVLILDWVNAGRGHSRSANDVNTAASTAGDEIWSMRSYASTIELLLGPKLVIRERTVLDNSNPPPQLLGTSSATSVARRLSPYNVYATVIILGPHLRGFSDHLSKLCDETRQYQASKPEDVVWSFSVVADGGGVLRVAGVEVEDVRKWLRAVFVEGGVDKLVGEGVWPRII